MSIAKTQSQILSNLHASFLVSCEVWWVSIPSGDDHVFWFTINKIDPYPVCLHMAYEVSLWSGLFRRKKKKKEPLETALLKTWKAFPLILRFVQCPSVSNLLRFLSALQSSHFKRKKKKKMKFFPEFQSACFSSVLLRTLSGVLLSFLPLDLRLMFSF